VPAGRAHQPQWQDDPQVRQMVRRPFFSMQVQS
jgi:hypothetical protein